MNLKRLVVLMTMLLGLLTSSTALAHGGILTTGRGTISMEPSVPLADQPVVVTVKPLADDGHALTGGTLTGKFKQAGTAEISIPFKETQPGLYTASITFREKDWHASLQFDDATGTKMVTDTGFTVFTKPEAFGAVSNRKIDWRQGGVTVAPAWTDTVTWVLLVVAPILGAALLWHKQGNGYGGLPLAKPRSIVPPALMTVATLGALAMPLSGFWDIAWHHDQGRDGLLSPPHLGIYGGIITTLLALGIGVKAAGGLKKIKEVPAILFALLAMVIQLASAPLDELWHRLMGLDVSVWAPPHDMLIFGAAFASIGLAAIEATSDPQSNGIGSRVRIMGFGVAALAILNAFLAEFEFQIPAWHISQSRPHGLYPTLFVLSMAATLIPVARLTRMKFAATVTAIVFWLLRAAEIYWYLPWLKRSVPNFPPLFVLLAAIAIDLVVQAKGRQGRARYALAGIAAAVTVFFAYQPLAGLLPIKAVDATQLVIWFPVAVIVAAATGYLAGWLGDYVLHGAAASPKADSVDSVACAVE